MTRHLAHGGDGVPHAWCVVRRLARQREGALLPYPLAARAIAKLSPKVVTTVVIRSTYSCELVWRSGAFSQWFGCEARRVLIAVARSLAIFSRFWVLKVLMRRSL